VQTKTLARIGAVAFVAIAITATAIQMREAPAPAPEKPALASGASAVDPLRAELARCQSLGQGGATDPDCLRAWTENRRRFFGLDRNRAPDPARSQPVDVIGSTAAEATVKSTAPATNGDR
jgi:conjugative transfer region protein TrbK